MKKILLPVSFIFLMGLFPEQLFARELSRAEINQSSFYDKSQIAKVILIENDSERQRMLIEIRLLLSLYKYYTAGIVGQYRSVDGEYFIVYGTGYRILIAIGSSALEIRLYNSQNDNSEASEIRENTYDKIVESIEMFEFINGVNTSLVPPPEPIYEIDPSDIIPEIVGYIPERPSERQFDERTQLEYEIVDGRNVTITRYAGNATTLNIPAQIQGLPVTAIGNYTFQPCDSLKSITIPSSVTTIGGSAFAVCSSLTSVTIPSSVTSIGDIAFSDCERLTNVSISSSVMYIGGGAFWGCSSLTSITVENRNPYYASIDGILFDKNIRTIIKYPDGKTARTYTIPSSVTTIGGGAFYNCSNLTSITIPSSVTSVGWDAFYWCHDLTSVTLSRRTQVREGEFPETVRIIYSD